MKIKELVEAPVISSWIDDISWQDSSVIMTLQNGQSYEIINVPESVYQSWLAAHSKGRYWHDVIKGNYFISLI